MHALAFLLALFARSPSLDGGPFVTLTLPQALAEAEKAQKVVMIDYFTTWCGPCKKLDRETWTDAKVRAWLAEHAVALKLDAEREAETAGRHGVRAYPTMLFLRPDGTEIGRLVGFRGPGDFVAQAADVLAGKSSVDRAQEKLEAAGGNDPMLRKQLAHELSEAGRHAEALEHYLWCWDHGLEHDSSFSGVRVSFLLSEVARLGRSHPPALEALRERRNACEAALMEGGPITSETASDLAHLNDVLGEPDGTLRAYDALLAREDLSDRELRAVRYGLFDKVVGQLLAARRYEDVLDGVGDYEQAVERAFLVSELSASMEEKHPELVGMAKTRAVRDGARYYEALLGLGRAEEASALRERLAEFDPRPVTFDVLRRHAKSAGVADEADRMRERTREARKKK